MSASIELSEAILNDMRNLKPVAWIYWQVIEHTPYGNDGSDWGLIGADFRNSTTSLDIRLSFYGFAQYTKFIRPGYQIISSNDNDTLAAFDANSKTLVLFNINICSSTAYRTSKNNETLKFLPNIGNITDGILTYRSPAHSITTWVFSLATANFTQ
ncbi:Glycoside Hydrolase Family 30 protein [Gigaspora rosea]|uniref:Glycoside Hydrolase Family 30 protein n=1 Tax=Gigaspora rosea TaxID=44941 RepID=A0A397VN98_9GLOM|nr:Glycoside Hydrolase Family 30 protein [Gigaspora rosea]